MQRVSFRGWESGATWGEGGADFFSLPLLFELARAPHLFVCVLRRHYCSARDNDKVAQTLFALTEIVPPL
jgi:hypothetical protein